MVVAAFVLVQSQYGIQCHSHLVQQVLHCSHVFITSDCLAIFILKKHKAQAKQRQNFQNAGGDKKEAIMAVAQELYSIMEKKA